MEQPKEYYAFISYKREDKKEAKRLQHALEYYRLPNHLRQDNPKLPEYVRPVFRDMTDLEVGELSAQIHSALEQSHFLIVVCSPRAAASKWVNDEVEYFISLGKQDKIIPYIIEGVPYADNPDEECYPPALLRLSNEKELLGANINEVGKDSATIRVVSRMFNIRFDMLYQRYQREQKKHRRQLTAAIILAFLFLFGIAGWIWHQNILLKGREWKMMENQARAVCEKANQLTNEMDSYSARCLLLGLLSQIKESDMLPILDLLEFYPSLRSANRHKNAVLRGHTSDVNSIAFSPDGRHIVSASNDGTLRIWDLLSGKEEKKLEEHTANVTAAEYSPDGKYIISASEDETIRIWDSDTGEPVCNPLTEHKEGVTSVSFSKDGSYFVSASAEGHVIIWNFATKQRINDFYIEHGDVNYSVSFSPDGKYIISTSWFDDSIRMWDAVTTKTVNTFLIENEDFINSAKFSQDGKFIVSTSQNNPLIIWEVQTKEKKKVLKNHYSKTLFEEYDVYGGATSAVFSPNGRYIASTHADGTLLLWDSENGEEIQSLIGSAIKANSVCFSPDGKYVAYTTNGNIIRIWDFDGLLTSNETLIGYDHASFSPDGIFIASSSDNTIRIWNVISGEQIGQTIECSSSVSSVSFSPDGKYLVAALEDRTICVWDTDTRNLIYEPIAANGQVDFSSFSPYGQYIVSSNGRIWNMQNREENLVFTDSKLSSVTHSGRYIIGVSFINEVVEIWGWGRLYGNGDSWNHEELRLIKKIVTTNCPYVLDISADGKYIVYATSDNLSFFIYDIEKEKEIRTLNGHTASINSVTFSPDGKYILSASDDKTIRIWDVNSGMQVEQPLKGHLSSVRYAKFSPNGRHIVSESFDKTVRIWNFPSPQELIDSTRECFKDRQLTPEERRKYYLE